MSRLAPSRYSQRYSLGDRSDAASGNQSTVASCYRKRKCAENYHKRHNKFVFKTAISILVISNHNSFRVLFEKKLLPYILFEKYIYIFGLEMASPWNQHLSLIHI